MRTTQELDRLQEQAVTLRRQGKSRREIKEILGIASSTLNQILRGEPLPPERVTPGYAESKRRAAEGLRRYWAAEHPVREAARTAISAAAAAELGELTDREIILAGAIAYWCEGAKSKPYRLDEYVRFVNSDPALIRFFLKFLEKAGVSRDRLRYRVHIHESADVDAALSYWASVTGATPDQFARPVIKRHTPRTSMPRDNTDYQGCLQVSVTKSSGLYRDISGWAHGVMTAKRLGAVSE
jgi:transcriptional regulator with XRE-family HTH domain